MDRFQIDKLGWIKIWKGAVVAVLGALITYVLQTVGNLDFGVYTPIVVSLISIAVNAVRKWLADYSV